jgi:3,4-dihydroxy 2-butanone 4-phosphate synthase/GTP cyclohydrolase II
MMRLPDLRKFCAEHNLLLSSIAQLIEYRRHNERLVERMGEAQVPTEFGTFTCVAYKSTIDNIEHLAFVKGDVTGDAPILVRVHSECLTGDVFGSRRCDCGPQLATAMQMVDEAGAGVIVYLRGHEGRGIGIGHKIRAYSLQDEGFDTVDANTELGLPIDSREYGIGAQILADLGVRQLRLMTNNPAKYGGLGGYGLSVVERVALNTVPTPENEAYLRTKRERMGHHIDMHDGKGEGK